MTDWLSPPEGWRDRQDAHEFAVLVAELAYAEAEVLRAQERLRVAAPPDDDWRTLYAWAETADRWAESGDPFTLLASLGAAQEVRVAKVRAVQDKIIQWHDEDRKR